MLEDRSPERIGINECLNLLEANASKERSGKMVYIAAMPKSGGTFLSKKLSEYLEWSYEHASDIPGSCEFDVYRPKMIELASRNVVIHQHTLGTEGNSTYINRYSDLILVQTRNIFDALLSFRRHLENESLGWAFMTIQKPFKSMDSRDQLDLIIDLVGPWMLNFVVTWDNRLRDPNITTKVLPICYSEIVESEKDVLENIIVKLTGDCDQGRLSEVLAVNRSKYRKNENFGRVDVAFTGYQIDKIRKMSKHFPETDFSRVGI